MLVDCYQTSNSPGPGRCYRCYLTVIRQAIAIVMVGVAGVS